MKHLGDITKIHGNEIDAVDCITGGSPCQDLSIAGKREGLAGNRSGLFTEMIRIIKEMRERDIKDGKTDYDIRPRFVIWENVPGAFSSNKGADFGCVLEEFARIKEPSVTIPRPTDRKGRIKWKPAGCIVGNSWSIAWRTLDAQFWGVPQRRKRIALVADFGGATAPEILFERKGLSRDTSESGKEGQGIAENSERSTNPTSYTLKIRGGREIDSLGHKAGKGALIQTELSATLGVTQDQTLICLNDQGGQQMSVTKNISGTLRAQEHGHQPIVYGISAYESNAMKSANPHSGIYKADTARTLDLNGGSPACNQGGMAVVQGADVYNGALTGEVAATLTNACGGSNTSGAKVLQSAGVDTYNRTMDEEVAQPLRATDGGDSTPKVVCIEGNGQREPHKGDGYKESETMYTLNSTEHHAVAVENYPADSRVKVSDDGMVQTLSSRMGTGGGNVPLVMEEPICLTRRFSSVNVYEDGITPTLEAGAGEGGNNMPMVYANEAYDKWSESEKGASLRASGGVYGGGNESLSVGYVVRRLTPLECERLQGFPTVRKVMFTEMTKDEYIAWNISEGHIVVDTEYGKVFATRGPGGVKLDEPKELTGTILNGYRVVSIRNGETKMQCRVHRIVWIAEHGVIPDGYVIDHINNDKQDNRLCNLQLLTAVENSTKARADGLYKIHGEAGQAKITDEVHDFIQYVYGNTDLSIRQLSEIFGISKSRVHQIIYDEAWTDIGEWYDSKGKKHKNADSPRYKALGNSIALPQWQWIIDRMAYYLPQGATLGSLFDGIGGFPLCWQRTHGNGTAVWASEVEKFCIAVTNKRFNGK